MQQLHAVVNDLELRDAQGPYITIKGPVILRLVGVTRNTALDSMDIDTDGSAFRRMYAMMHGGTTELRFEACVDDGTVTVRPPLVPVDPLPPVIIPSAIVPDPPTVLDDKPLKKFRRRW